MPFIKKIFHPRLFTVIALIHLFVFTLNSESEYVMFHSMVSFVLLSIALIYELFLDPKIKNNPLRKTNNEK